MHPYRSMLTYDACGLTSWLSGLSPPPTLHLSTIAITNRLNDDGPSSQTLPKLGFMLLLAIHMDGRKMQHYANVRWMRKMAGMRFTAQLYTTSRTA